MSNVALINNNLCSNGCLYGPVVSRRLGVSIGVDLFTKTKVCSFNCVYCEVGKTKVLTDKIANFADMHAVIAAVENFLAEHNDIQYISFAGYGEPTLHKELGYIIRTLKSISTIPVAVFTNSSLLGKEEVRQALYQADVILPSLDSARQITFTKINRPVTTIKVRDIVRGLLALRQEYAGQIWLEILLVAGINDTPQDLRVLAKVATLIKPDRIQLNTVWRRGAETWALPLTKQQLASLIPLFGPRAEVV